MVIDNFNVKSIALLPTKTYSPLIVYSDTVLTFPVAPELLQLVSRWHSQVIESFGSIQQEELSKRRSTNVLREFGYRLPQKNLFGLFASKRLYHYLE